MSIEAICGSMFSGKSERICALIRRAKRGRLHFLNINHGSDTRYGEGVTASHNGDQEQAWLMTSAWDIVFALFNPPEEFHYLQDLTPNHLKPEFEDLHLIIVDEAQFFEQELADILRFIDCIYAQMVIDGVRQKELKIVAAGLDQDFRGEPFGQTMPRLLSFANTVTKLQAVCTSCGDDATRTQRLIVDQPASFDDPIILVGAQDAYTTRCAICHDVPGAPMHRIPPEYYVYQDDFFELLAI